MSLVYCFLSHISYYFILIPFFFGDSHSFTSRKLYCEERNVERPKREWQMYKCHKSYWSCGGLSAPFSTDTFFSRQALFYLVQDMPALNKLQGAESRVFSLCIALPITLFLYYKNIVYTNMKAEICKILRVS